MAPVMQDMMMATDKPQGPSHSPPTPNNFMSPMPIGGVLLSWLRFWTNSKTLPVSAPKIKPNAPPKTADDMPMG